MRSVEFYFDLMSPFSYLAATRIDAIAAAAGAEAHWKPFFLPGVMKATGNRGPTETFAKALYAHKDLNDWARHLNLPVIELPDTFPFLALTADRLAFVAAEHGKMREWCQRMFKSIWVQRADCNDPAVLTAELTAIGLDPVASLERAKADDIKAKLKANTDEAVEKGAFGAPTFFVDGEMFVGNDRLMFVEAALKR
jgi:2-hydroxychromene-2-carboxylate isomerase